MSSGFKLSSLCVLALLFSWACAPDLDSLVAGNNAGSAGSNGESGGPPAGPGSCENGVKNADESDIDCGGTSKCDRCENKLACKANRDCASEFCKGSVCATATCGDGYQNSDETAIDCGGNCAPENACEVDVACKVDADCISQFCKDELCVEHCGSGKREADESDIDCGGADCEPCEEGDRCGEGSDCLSQVCNNNECQPGSCSDNIQNQDESDKDCGGSCIAEDKPCDLNRRCKTASDCDSYLCVKGKCGADLVIPAADMIDNFEDGDLNLTSTGGRAGNWYWYGDGSGIANVAIERIDRGRSSINGIHTTGGDFSIWGSGIGVDLKNMGSGQTQKEVYDASAYIGVTFWGRASSTLMISAVLPDSNTDAAGGKCEVCDHHYAKPIQLSTEWQRFTVNFAEDLLEPETGTMPPPEMFDSSGIVALQFRVGAGTTYEFWIDDVAFVK
jgi:hypothetical protein